MNILLKKKKLWKIGIFLCFLCIFFTLFHHENDIKSNYSLNQPNLKNVVCDF